MSYLAECEKRVYPTKTVAENITEFQGQKVQTEPREIQLGISHQLKTDVHPNRMNAESSAEFLKPDKKVQLSQEKYVNCWQNPRMVYGREFTIFLSWAQNVKL